MLEDCLVESRSSKRSRHPLTLLLSALTHGAIGAALILIPLFQHQVLPNVPLPETLRPPAAPQRSIELVAAPRPSGGSAPPNESGGLIAPEAIPEQIVRIVDGGPPTVAGLPPGPGGGIPNGIPGGLGVDIGSTAVAAPPPPPPPPAPAPPPAPEPDSAPTAPIRRGGVAVMADLVHQVLPEYPPLARLTRTQGIVILEAVITREGTIDPKRLRIVSGHRLLVEAAVDAVRQWRYRPTLLNGQPVEIITTITVNFTFD